MHKGILRIFCLLKETVIKKINNNNNRENCVC